MRAKFNVESITDFGNNFKRVKLNAVYSNDKNSEDNQFSSATPSGSLEMVITNPNAIDFLKVSKSYYLDFTEAE